jgi:hypothetical protein
MKIILLLILFVSLYSCQNIQEEPIDKKTAISTFTINPSKRNIVQGKNNGILIVPKDCFVDEEGNVIEEDVEVQLTEAYSIEDMLDYDLETISSEGLLVSDGMINLEAKTVSGKKVKITEEKTIVFQKASSLVDTNQYQFFSQPGELWANPKPASPYLTYCPIEEHTSFVFIEDEEKTRDFNKIVFSNSKEGEASWRLVDSLSFSNFIASYKQLQDISDTILSNSYASSFEYGQRFILIPPYDELSISVHFFYLKNMDKPLWLVDSMIAEEYKSILPSYKDDSYNYQRIERIVNLATNFKRQYKTTLSPDKFTDKDLEELKRFYQKKRVNEFIQTYRVNKLGWHNIDYFYDQSELIPTTLSIDCNKDVKRVALVFKGIKTVLQAKKSKNNSYCFGLSERCSIKMPHIQGYLIAVGEENGQFFFAKKEIKIGQNKEEELELKPSSQEEISKVLEEIEKGYQ